MNCLARLLFLSIPFLIVPEAAGACAAGSLVRGHVGLIGAGFRPDGSLAYSFSLIENPGDVIQIPAALPARETRGMGALLKLAKSQYIEVFYDCDSGTLSLDTLANISAQNYMERSR